MNTTLMRSLVTPGVVAPPLLSPAFHGFTHAAPPPTTVVSKRPYGPYFGSSWRQLGLSSAAGVPIPDAFTGGPAPSGRCTVEVAARAAPPGTTSAAASAHPVSDTSARRARRLFIAFPQTSRIELQVETPCPFTEASVHVLRLVAERVALAPDLR